MYNMCIPPFEGNDESRAVEDRTADQHAALEERDLKSESPTHPDYQGPMTRAEYKGLLRTFALTSAILIGIPLAVVAGTNLYNSYFGQNKRVESVEPKNNTKTEKEKTLDSVLMKLKNSITKSD